MQTFELVQQRSIGATGWPLGGIPRQQAQLRLVARQVEGDWP
jgi:hypothetical protein